MRLSYKISELYGQYKEAFGEPLKNKTFVFVCFIAFLTNMAILGANIIAAVDLTSAGMWEVMRFLTIEYALLGLLMPLFIWILPRLRPKSFLAIFGGTLFLPFFGTLFLSDFIPLSILYGVGLSALVGIAWSLLHPLMSIIVTDKNSGHETAFFAFSVTSGNFVGALVGGAMSVFMADKLAILIMLGVSAASMLVLCLYCLKKELPIFQPDKKFVFKEIFEKIIAQPGRSVMTSLQGVTHLATYSLVPFWLKILGMNGLGIGIIAALRISMQTLFAPMAGRLAMDDPTKGLKLGCALKLAGWMPWLVSANPLMMIFANLFWSGGNHLFSVGLDNDWYRDRSFASQASREVLLALGRLILIPILVPALFLFYQYYAYIGMASVLVIYAFTKLYTKDKQRLATAELQAAE